MSRVSGVLCFLLVSGALPGGQAFTDEAESSSTAYRVRVTAPGFANRPIVGTLIAINDKTITIQGSRANDIAVPAQTLTRFEVSRKAGRKRKGAAIGGLVGVAAGAAIGFSAGDDCGEADSLPPRH